MTDTLMPEAIRLLRERARQASDAAGAILRWSYLLEMHATCVEAGVPLPEDGRNFLSRPLLPVKKAASIASDGANPFLLMTANETLQMLEPAAVQMATIKRRTKRAADERREDHWDAMRALEKAACVLGADVVLERAQRLADRAKGEQRYLEVAKRVHDEEAAPAATGPNVVTFPGART